MSDSQSRISVLVVDDEESIGRLLTRCLTRMGCTVEVAKTLAAAREALARTRFELLLVDFHLPDGTGAELIKSALAGGRASCAYCISGGVSCKNAVAAMQAGAADIIEKPLDLDHIDAIITARRAAESADLSAWRREFAPLILGEDPALLEVLGIVRSVAETGCTVLIHGESGTGKEELARTLHFASSRKHAPFVALNCAAIPENLLESELFGHARGSFTGAAEARVGKFVAADGGTIFLDEIGDLPLNAQAKLLRVLQDHLVTPVGADRATQINVRVVAATNKDLEAMVDEGTFRADLFFRLSVIGVDLPSLRERSSDVVPLARGFIRASNEKHSRAVSELLPDAELALNGYSWPGNIRELLNVIERAVVLKGQGPIGAADLRLSRRTSQKMRTVTAAPEAPAASGHTPPSAANLNLRDALDDVEKRLIEEALGRTNGNRTEAAVLLGLNRSTLVEKLRKHTG